jgi:hypothetical protein
MVSAMIYVVLNCLVVIYCQDMQLILHTVLVCHFLRQTHFRSVLVRLLGVLKSFQNLGNSVPAFGLILRPLMFSYPIPAGAKTSLTVLAYLLGAVSSGTLKSLHFLPLYATAQRTDVFSLAFYLLGVSRISIVITWYCMMFHPAKAVTLFQEELYKVQGDDFVWCGAKNSVFDLHTGRVARIAFVGGE